MTAADFLGGMAQQIEERMELLGGEDGSRDTAGERVFLSALTGILEHGRGYAHDNESLALIGARLAQAGIEWIREDVGTDADRV